MGETGPTAPRVQLESRATTRSSLAGSIVRLRIPLVLLVLVITLLNRVVLHAVALPRDLPYLLWGRIATDVPTQEWPYESPWFVLPLLAGVLFVVRPGAITWGLLVVTFVLPHLWPYSIGPIELWGVRIIEFSPDVLRLLHLPLAVMLVILVLLVRGRDQA